MPRVRVTQVGRMPVSIPAFAEPVCPRCLGIDPGTPEGDPNDPHPGPFAEVLCDPCRNASEGIAPWAVAIRPMQPWPRHGMPSIPDGPSRLAMGPRDFEGLGKERFWDQTPLERREASKTMHHDRNVRTIDVPMNRFIAACEDKAFAKGWLDELQKVKIHERNAKGWK